LFVLQDLVDSAVTAQQLEDSLDDLASGVQAATKLGQALEAEAAVAVANEVVDLAEATEVKLARLEQLASTTLDDDDVELGVGGEGGASEGMRVAALRTTLAAVEGATRQLTWAYMQVRLALRKRRVRVRVRVGLG